MLRGPPALYCCLFRRSSSRRKSSRSLHVSARRLTSRSLSRSRSASLACSTWIGRQNRSAWISKARTGSANGDQAGPARPDHQTAPAQDSTHTRTGANQRRTRVRRYSLGAHDCLRVRERRIFLGVGEFFPLPSAGREKVRGSPKIGGKKSGEVCEQIMNFGEVAHCVPVFVIN